MPKKCILCEKEAEYGIKGSSETYCKECAVEQFQDVDYLQKIEDMQVKKVISLVEDSMEQELVDKEIEDELSDEE